MERDGAWWTIKVLRQGAYIESSLLPAHVPVETGLVFWSCARAPPMGEG
jgi:hypothetical protein